MFEDGPYTLKTLSVALLFAAIFLFGGRAAYRPGQKGRQRFLSFAAGISVGYTFVHVLPALSVIRELHTQSPSKFNMVFPEYSVYLWTMVGFLVFYSLETMGVSSRIKQENGVGDDDGAAPWRPWVHIGGFVLYAWLLTYLILWSGKGVLALCLYAAAMGLHIFMITCNLSSRYGALYDRRGALLLALASLVGWASGLVLEIPEPILLDLVAVVAGGVIVNAAIAELPKEQEGRSWAFLTGTFFFTALLLTLSHFEKGG